MISADFEGFVNLTVKVGKSRAKILISGAVSADSVDSSAANRWLCRGFERNSTLFLPENFILMYNRLNKSRHITQKKKGKSIPAQKKQRLGGDIKGTPTSPTPSLLIARVRNYALFVRHSL